MKSDQISGCIISCNNEWSIKKAIRSLMPIVNEIIIFDSLSTDTTHMVAEMMQIKVIKYDNLNTQELKSLIERCCTNDWIYILYANEYISSDLQDEIQYIFSNKIQNKYKAYSVPIKTIGNEDLVERFYCPKTREIRIYNKSFSTLNYNYEDLKDTKHLWNFYGNKNDVYQLQNKMHTRLRLHLYSFIDQINMVSSFEANRLSPETKRPSIIQIIFLPIFTFFKFYILKRYFVLGFSGFIDSYVLALQKMFFLAKIIEKKAFFNKKNK